METMMVTMVVLVRRDGERDGPGKPDHDTVNSLLL